MRKINQTSPETLQLQKPGPSAVAEEQEEPVPMKLESGNSHHNEGWKSTALLADEDPGALSIGVLWLSLSPSGPLEGRSKRLW